MTSYESYSLIGQYIGLGVIFCGIRAMRKGTDARAVDSERKHEENMKALNDNHTALMKLIERTGG